MIGKVKSTNCSSYSGQTKPLRLRTLHQQTLHSNRLGLIQRQLLQLQMEIQSHFHLLNLDESTLAKP